jgi:tellurite resistance protein
MPALSAQEALLRVALLVSAADGTQTAEERVTVAQGLQARFGPKALDSAQLWAASTEITTTPVSEVLAAVRAALPEEADRLRAFEFACRVAMADRQLTQAETARLMEVAHGLGLSSAEASRIAGAAWT